MEIGVESFVSQAEAARRYRISAKTLRVFKISDLETMRQIRPMDLRERHVGAA